MAKFQLYTIVAPCFIILVCLSGIEAGGKFTWLQRDRFDEIVGKYINAIKGHNCAPRSKADMMMRDDIVTQIPKANELLSKVFYSNRSVLVHMHNMALNRAFFMSYILQRMNSTEDYSIQPNLHYLYMSVTADINANPYAINGSSIIFDKDVYYPNWLTNLDFNKTIPLFGVKGWRKDNTFAQGNFIREPNRRVVQCQDIGAGNNKNYTHDGYKMNPWYDFWLPDLDGQEDKSNKFTYSVGIRYSNVTGKFIKEDFDVFNFFGPNLPSQSEKDIGKMPVRFTVPYFDCGKSNTWKVSAVAPIVDFFPRYSNYTHMRRQRFVGVITMDTDFMKIDFNPCGVSAGNPGPSYLAGVARCKDHTGCKAKSGKGYGRGGYICHCKGKYVYPMDIQGPYDGKLIEMSTNEERANSFNCIRGDHYRVLPIVDQNADVTVEFGVANINTRKKRSLLSINETDSVHFGSEKQGKVEIRERETVKETTKVEFEQNHKKKEKKRRRKRTTDYGDRSEFDQMRFDRMIRIFRQKVSINKDNCKSVPASSLNLPGDAAYDVENQFKYQGATALRLSHFLSIFLETVQITDNFGNLRGGGRLHQDHLFGEVLANVMGDHRILSSGIFFEPYIFENQDGTAKELFGPYAFKDRGVAKAIDMAGLPRKYIFEDWYQNIKQSWETNTAKLKKHKMNQLVRSDAKGTSSIKFEYYPIGYYAPKYEDGLWSHPKFKCDGMTDNWVMTYSIPFFRRDYVAKKNKFAGVVTVDVPLDNLEINQCPMAFSVANAFKNTARCHKSTKCKMIPGYKYSRGAYRCDCKQGYEYQFADGKNFIEGSLVELEYEKKVKGLFSRFDSLVCRVQGGATAVAVNYFSVLIGMIVSLMMSR
ncbi:uncharacterized protein LOC143079760 [Mytilus galloprovincialis]|uniref:uncharacterized protein LOC143079760 n=1 Tax=Mytilus galloprovincialis TaxID=29158 RepID=UPI003F7BBB65